MKSRKKIFKKESKEQNFWPAFTDVMSTVALILFFLMLLAYIQSIIISADLERKNEELKIKGIELANTENELIAKRLELESTRKDVEQARKEKAMLELENSENKRIIDRNNEELLILRTKLEGIAVMRLDILKKVKESIENELGKTTEDGQDLVTIGDNANIVINESVVFEFDSYDIKPDGEELIEQFAIAFEKILDDVSVRKNIDAIIIEGHTDDRGSPSYNRELSTKRATTVVNFMMNSNSSLQNKYGQYFTAAGFSEYRPLAYGTSENARRKNRRIEISIDIKDSSVQRVINDYLEKSIIAE